MILPFIYIGNPILRKKSLPIHTIDQEILTLIENMKDTVKSFHGLGMAAPQVGVSLALFVACFPIRNADGTLVPGPPRVFINPKIEDPSQETWTEQEGNPCIPGIYAPVDRPVSITISYQDEQGAWQKTRLSGWEAKIVMHENDHLNGVLFIDRLDPAEKKKNLEN
jgi:peptide deformylase